MIQHNQLSRSIAITMRSLVFVSIAALFATGCGPRGESHTLDQVFTDARESYTGAVTKVAPEVNNSLKSLTSALDRIAGVGGGGDARQVSRDIAGTLTDLSVKAGLTVRPAMSELINQYRSVANSTAAPVALGAANLKLLAARTYNLLAAELKTTQFKL